MKSLFRTLRLTGVFGLAVLSAASHAKAQMKRGEFVVNFDPGTTLEKIREVLSQAGFGLVEQVSAHRLSFLVRMPVATEATSEVTTMAVRALSSLPGVRYAEPNFVYRIFDTVRGEATSDPRFDEQWNMENSGQKDAKGQDGLVGADISASKAWARWTGSKNIVVAVVDTGIDYNHPDLKPNMWNVPGKPGVYGRNFAGGFWGNKDKPLDNNDHGSHCAGIIGARGNDGVGVTGVNWTTSLMAVKALDGQGGGTESGLVKGIEWAVDNGARVISASWGGEGFSQELERAVQHARSKGVLFIAAAGNGASDGKGDDNNVENVYPAAYARTIDNVIAVAASDNRDALTVFSNYGTQSVALGAPGHRILSTVRSSKYAVFSGTSMAAPHVAGAAAFLWSREPGLTYQQVKARLMGSVDIVPGLQGRTITGGRLNINRLIGAN